MDDDFVITGLAKQTKLRFYENEIHEKVNHYLFDIDSISGKPC